MWQLLCSYIIGTDNLNTVDILPKCNNLSWSNDEDTLAVQLSFDSLYDLAEGRSHIILRKNSNEVFQGIITNKDNKEKSSSYTAMDYAIFLKRNGTEEIFQFNNIDAKSAIYQVLTKYGIKGACIQLNTKINKIYKGKSCSDIIDDILDQCKNEIGEDIIKEMRKDVLWIDKVSNLKVDCKYKMSNDFSVTRSIEDMVNNVTVISNEENDQVIYANVKDDNNISIFGKFSHSISVDKVNESQATNIAQNYLKSFNGTKKEMTITLEDIEGCENIRAKRKISISIKKYGVDGYFKVKSASHTLTNNRHKINVTIDFSEVDFTDTTESITIKTGTDSSTSSSSNSTTSTGTQSDIIAYAKQFLGTPYVWGGKTPSGFDCSGYVAYVFKHFGISLTAYTFTMVNEGTRVSSNNMQVADLLFFNNTNHVGIYIGNNQFIHSPKTGDVVKVSPLAGYYSSRLNAVVRVL